MRWHSSLESGKGGRKRGYCIIYLYGAGSAGRSFLLPGQYGSAYLWNCVMRGLCNPAYCFWFLGISIFRLGMKGEGGGFILYAQDLDTVCEYLHDEDYEEAEELLEKMKEEYGETDSLYMLSAIQYLSQGKPKEAWDAYYQISDKDSMVAIVIAEKIYELDETGDSTSKLYDLYCRAAERYPEWEYIQLCAGVMKIDFKQYNSALYYLYNAYAVNQENPQTLYFLGVASYKTGKTEDALYYFNASVENGADNTVKALIKGYLDEMDYWGEGAEAE